MKSGNAESNNNIYSSVPEIRRMLDAVVTWPGLTPDHTKIRDLKQLLSRKLGILLYKKNAPHVWAVFIGGTGTGKSTLFNALSGADVSKTGVERPKTEGPVVYAHKNGAVRNGFPFADYTISSVDEKSPGSLSQAGIAGGFVIVEHDRDALGHIALVDTPDLDSIEAYNRRMAEDFYLLSDLIVFVSSQEKYADEVPSQFFRRIYTDEKPYFFLVNKTDGKLVKEDVLTFFSQQGIDLEYESVRFIPYISVPTRETMAAEENFRVFSSVFMHLCHKDRLPKLIQEGEARNLKSLAEHTAHLLLLMEREEDAGREWLATLDSLFDESTRDLLDKLGQFDSNVSQAYIQDEIRKIFSRYDVLGKPRRYIAGLVLAPLRFLGIKIGATPRSHKRDLLKIGRKIDMTPLMAAMDRFNRVVLEQLSPQDERSLLFAGLRRAEMVLTNDEISALIREEQEKLAGWVEDTFEALARGISKGKELGIYSTSILWGIMIVAFEIVLGGGISILEAVLDSVLAPFVTKGSAELFASREIKNIARTLDQRYRESLVAVLKCQRDRYAECLAGFMIPVGVVDTLRAFETDLEGHHE